MTEAEFAGQPATPLLKKVDWKCTRCGTTDTALAYRSGRMKLCKDCQRYNNLQVNAAKLRKHGYSPEVKITHTEFTTWARLGERRCHYCRIEEHRLVLLEQKSSIGRTVEALGIDRLDNTSDYVVGNIAWCCYACNKVKGNVFSEAEMRLIGRTIEMTWIARLAALDAAHQVPRT